MPCWIRVGSSYADIRARRALAFLVRTSGFCVVALAGAGGIPEMSAEPLIVLSRPAHTPRISLPGPMVLPVVVADWRDTPPYSVIACALAATENAATRQHEIQISRERLPIYSLLIQFEGSGI